MRCLGHEGGVLMNEISALILGFPSGTSGKEHACRCRRHRRQGSIPGSGRSPGGNGIPLQYSCLENPMDRGAWWAAVHRVTKNWTPLPT